MKNPTDKRGDTREPMTDYITFEASPVQCGRLTCIRSEAKSLDLSSHGVGMTTKFPLKRGDVVKVFIPMREGKAKLPVYSEVMWSAVKSGEYRAGLRFLS